MQFVHKWTYMKQSYSYTYTCLHIHTYTNTCTNISRVSDQNGISLLYIMLEIHHSGWEPSIYSHANKIAHTHIANCIFFLSVAAHTLSKAKQIRPRAILGCSWDMKQPPPWTTSRPCGSTASVYLFVGCLMSQQHVSVLGWGGGGGGKGCWGGGMKGGRWWRGGGGGVWQMISGHWGEWWPRLARYWVADQTFLLTQSQYTDTGPTSPSTGPIAPGGWQGRHWSANFEVTGMTRPPKNPDASGIWTRDLPLSRQTP